MSVPRQSGKSKLISDVADHRALTLPDARIWYTAQTGKDASAWMRDEHFTALARTSIFGRPGRPGCAYDRSRRAGQEGINWGHGSTFRVFPPMRDSLHGRQSDLVFLDEAWAYNPEQGADVRQAVRPTMATRVGAQLWIVSTAGDDASTFLDGYLEAGAAAVDDPASRIAFVDYGLREGDDPEDLDVVMARHPAAGLIVPRESFQAARDDFGGDVSGWTRAYGNLATRTREAAFPPHVWAAAGTSRTPIPERAALGLDATPSGDRYALVAAWRDDGRWFVEVLDEGPPTRATPALVARVARARGVPVTIERGSIGALELVDALALEAPGVEVDRLAAADYAAACATFDRGIRAGEGQHFDDPALDAAVEVATRRRVGDGAWTWARGRSAGSIAPLVAGTVALKAFDRLPGPRRAPVASMGATRMR